MLHHANVDRLLAFWQAINHQNGRVQFRYQTRGLFGSPAGTTLTERSPVAPFDGANGPLTSLDVANIRDWGYTYEPLRYWQATPGQMRTEVTRTINRLYGPPQAANARVALPLGLGARNKRQERAVEKEYFAKVEVERSEVELPAAVELYVQKKLAGTFALLGMPEQGMSYDEIPLHQVLGQMALNITTPEEVARFIQENLEVSIRKVCYEPRAVLCAQQLTTTARRHRHPPPIRPQPQGPGRGCRCHDACHRGGAARVRRAEPPPRAAKDARYQARRGRGALLIQQHLASSHECR